MTAPVAAPAAPSTDPALPPVAAPAVAAPAAAPPESGGLEDVIKSLGQPAAVVPGKAELEAEGEAGAAPEGEGELKGGEAKPDTGEVKPEAKPEPPAEHLRDVPVPGRIGADGKQEFSSIQLKLPNQQAADAIGFHVKQSARVPVLEQELAAAAEDSATISFFDTKPVEGFTYLAELKPNAAKSWVGQYAKAYPDVVAQFLAEAGYEVKPTADVRALTAEAQLAQRELRDRATAARQEHHQTSVTQGWVQAAGNCVREVGTTIGLDVNTAEFRLFAQSASVELDRQYPQGGASREQIVLALQPLAQKAAQFLRTSPSTAPVVAALATPEKPANGAAPVTAPTPNTGAALDAKSQQADKFRRLGGGSPTVATFLPPASTNKAETLEEMTQRLQTT